MLNILKPPPDKKANTDNSRWLASHVSKAESYIAIRFLVTKESSYSGFLNMMG
jgi:hypothetical protein